MAKPSSGLLDEQSVDEIQRVGAWKMAAMSLHEAIVHDVSSKIFAAAVDSDRHILYVLYNKPTAPSLVAGLYGYELDTGRIVVTSPLPARTDMTGTTRRASLIGPAVFDFQRQACYVTTRLNNEIAVVRLSLSGSLPQVLARGYLLCEGAVLNEDTVLLKTSMHFPFQLAALDLETLQIEGPWDWPITIEDCSVSGTNNGYILVRQTYLRPDGRLERRVTVSVMRIFEQRLELVTSTENVSSCWSLSPPLVTSKGRGHVLVTFFPDGGWGVPVSPPTICSLPDFVPMVQLTDLDLDLTGLDKAFVLSDAVSIPGTDLIAIPMHRNAEFKIHSTRTGEALIERRLYAFPVEPTESWDVFVDQHNRYLGYTGMHWVQLFGVIE
jgi:hypothetical protein